MATTLATQLPKLADFPDAEIVGGAVLIDGKNMGTLMVGDEVEVSDDGRTWLKRNEEGEEVPELKPITEVPDPIPTGVIDPADHDVVHVRAKKEVRRRKQNEVVVDAMNSPTDEQEGSFQAAEEAAAAEPGTPESDKPPPAPGSTQGV